MGSKIKKYKRRRGRRRRKRGGGLYYRREKGRAGAERFTMTCHPRQPSVTRRMVVSSVIIALAHTRGAHSTARQDTHNSHTKKSRPSIFNGMACFPPFSRLCSSSSSSSSFLTTIQQTTLVCSTPSLSRFPLRSFYSFKFVWLFSKTQKADTLRA